MVAAVIFLAASSAASASSNCSAATGPLDRAAPLFSSVVDPAAAAQSQRRHLEALFNR